VPGQRLPTYERIHDCIARELHALRSELRAGLPQAAPEPPLVVVAHSLGAHIASNYLWDLQHPRPDSPSRPRAENAFELGRTLAGIVTFGCNIPLFTLAYDELLPITFPSPTLASSFPASTPPAKLAAAAKWINLYDPDDVLGYPLRPLSPAYARVVHEDIALNAGGFLTSWNPASHNAYWTDQGVTKRAAQLIEGLLELL
jgi:pimeloyl-ACP methyl ester carboxylesterase